MPDRPEHQEPAAAAPFEFQLRSSSATKAEAAAKAHSLFTHAYLDGWCNDTWRFTDVHQLTVPRSQGPAEPNWFVIATNGQSGLVIASSSNLDGSERRWLRKVVPIPKLMQLNPSLAIKEVGEPEQTDRMMAVQQDIHDFRARAREVLEPGSSPPNLNP